MIRKMLSCVLIALIASALPIPSSAATSSILAPKQWVLDQLVVSNASDFVTSNTNSIAYKAAHGGGGGGADTNAVKNIVTNTLSTIHINGQQLAENVTITTFSPFKTTWPTGSGINTFFSSVARDADAKDGTAFLGQLSGTSTPWETGNCEATLQVMKNTMGRLIYIVSVYSTDIYPYYWFNMSVSGGPGNGWRCYAPKSTTLLGYGITDAYTKEDIDGNSVTNGGAKAFSEATFLPKIGSDDANIILKSLTLTNDESKIEFGGFDSEILIGSCPLKMGNNNETSMQALNLFDVELGETHKIINFDNAWKVRFISDDGETFSDFYPDGSVVATSNMLNSIVPQFVTHTNPTFSNEVLAVGFGVSSNDVAVIREMVGTIGELPIGGGAATLGGLLAALVASIVWLKSNALRKGLTGGVPDDPNVSALFTRDNTSLMGVCRYPIAPIEQVEGLYTAADSTVNTITPSAATTIYKPSATGKARDYIVTVTQGATAHGVTFNGVFLKDFTDWPTMGANETYIFAFTEVATNSFMVAYKKVS